MSQLFSINGEQMDRCLKCKRFKGCPVVSRKTSEMPPEKVNEWIEKNCPHKSRIKFVPTGH